jgi:hypothetical protein
MFNELETRSRLSARRRLASEAELCRKSAVELAGRPEQPILLKIAAAFEELAERTPEHITN